MDVPVNAFQHFLYFWIKTEPAANFVYNSICVYNQGVKSYCSLFFFKNSINKMCLLYSYHFLW